MMCIAMLDDTTIDTIAVRDSCIECDRMPQRAERVGCGTCEESAALRTNVRVTRPWEHTHIYRARVVQHMQAGVTMRGHRHETRV